MRAVLVGTCAVLLAVPALAGDDPVADLLGTKAEREALVRDPNWAPRPGERAGVLAQGVLGCYSPSACQEAIRARQASDSLGQAGVSGVRLEKGTPVLVLRVYRPERKPLARAPGMTSEMMRQMMMAEFARAPDTSVWPLEVRVLEGPARDQVLHVPDDAIGVLATRLEPQKYLRWQKRDTLLHEQWDEWFRLERPPGKPAGATPSQEARSLFRLAERLERSGREDQAVGAYWFTLRDYEGTPAATDAAKRLRTMGLRRMPDGTLELDPRLTHGSTKRR